MEIILLERIEKLGAMGDVVNVKPGFARNFLLPQEKALRATKANLARFEAEREYLEQRNAENREKAVDAGKGVDGSKVIIIRNAGDTGQLYGSVSARDIAESLEDKGVKRNTQSQCSKAMRLTNLWLLKKAQKTLQLLRLKKSNTPLYINFKRPALCGAFLCANAKFDALSSELRKNLTRRFPIAQIVITVHSDEVTLFKPESNENVECKTDTQDNMSHRHIWRRPNPYQHVKFQTTPSIGCQYPISATLVRPEIKI